MPQQARDVPIRDESIRLGQFLKLADLIDSGSDAKAAIADGLVLVNGVVENSYGRVTRCRSTIAQHGSPRTDGSVWRSVAASSLGDRRQHPVSDRRPHLHRVGIDEFEAGGQDLPRDQIAMGLRPLRLLDGHRHRHRDAIGDVESG